MLPSRACDSPLLDLLGSGELLHVELPVLEVGGEPTLG